MSETFSVSLSADHLAVVLRGLGELPLKDSLDAFAAIRRQTDPKPKSKGPAK
jgi:hypothetical protein